MVSLTFTYTGIRVQDMERSLAFYRDLLGMKLLFRTRIKKQGGEVAVLQSPRGRQRLELNWYEPGSRYAAPYVAGEGLDHLAFRTPDLSKAMAEFRRKGLRIVDAYRGPRGGAWFYVEDPDGNWVEFCGPLSPS